MVALSLLVLAGFSPAADDPNLGRPADGMELAKRLSKGSVVVLARVAKVNMKAQLTVEKTYRGGPVGPELQLAFRAQNFGRLPGTEPLELKEGERDIFALVPEVNADGDPSGTGRFNAADGFLGRIPLPPEGAEALLVAVEEIVRYQDQEEVSDPAPLLVEWISGVNPWLIDYALDQAARLGITDPETALALVRRALDANPIRREQVALGLSQALERKRIDGRAKPNQEGSVREIRQAAEETLLRLARTDPEPRVRIAAVRGLASGSVPHAEEVLEKIGKDDPDQAVRYAAAAALLNLKERVH